MLESETRTHKEAKRKLILSKLLGKIFITSPQSLSRNPDMFQNPNFYFYFYFRKVGRSIHQI